MAAAQAKKKNPDKRTQNTPTIIDQHFPKSRTPQMPRRKRITASKEAVFLENVRKYKTQLERHFVIFCKLLAEVFTEKYYRPKYVNFQTYVETELGWSFKTAYNYVAVGLVTNEFKIDEDTAVQIGKSKMFLIAAYAGIKGVTQRHVEAAISNAEESATYGEFFDWIKMARESLLINRQPSGSTMIQATPLVTVKLKLPQTEIDWLSKILYTVKENLAQTRQTDITAISDEFALHQIVSEWAALKGLAVNGIPRDEPYDTPESIDTDEPIDIESITDGPANTTAESGTA
jgi:hypothetical protein